MEVSRERRNLRLGGRSEVRSLPAHYGPASACWAGAQASWAARLRRGRAAAVLLRGRPFPPGTGKEPANEGQPGGRAGRKRYASAAYGRSRAGGEAKRDVKRGVDSPGPEGRAPARPGAGTRAPPPPPSPAVPPLGTPHLRRARGVPLCPRPGGAALGGRISVRLRSPASNSQPFFLRAPRSGPRAARAGAAGSGAGRCVRPTAVRSQPRSATAQAGEPRWPRRPPVRPAARSFSQGRGRPPPYLAEGERPSSPPRPRARALRLYWSEKINEVLTLRARPGSSSRRSRPLPYCRRAPTLAPPPGGLLARGRGRERERVRRVGLAFWTRSTPVRSLA